MDVVVVCYVGFGLRLGTLELLSLPGRILLGLGFLPRVGRPLHHELVHRRVVFLFAAGRERSAPSVFFLFSAWLPPRLLSACGIAMLARLRAMYHFVLGRYQLYTRPPPNEGHVTQRRMAERRPSGSVKPGLGFWSNDAESGAV